MFTFIVIVIVIVIIIISHLYSILQELQAV